MKSIVKELDDMWNDIKLAFACIIFGIGLLTGCVAGFNEIDKTPVMVLSVLGSGYSVLSVVFIVFAFNKLTSIKRFLKRLEQPKG